MTRKKIIIIAVLAILIAIAITHFGFHDKIWNNVSESEKEKKEIIKKEIQELDARCFSKDLEDGKRVIMVSNANEKEGSKEIKGGDIVVNGDNGEIYSFLGYKKDENLINVFGEWRGFKEERIYKLTETGIIEGFVVEENREKIITKQNKALYIKDDSKVSFDEKFLIPNSDCN